MSFIDLHGRTSIVTGAAGGIGKAVCEELAKAKSNIALLDVDAEQAGAAATEIACRFAVSTRAYAVDVRNVEQIKQAVADVHADFGAVDHLINAHGVQFLSPFADFPDDKWRFILDINLQGLFHTTKSVWPYMLQRRRGRIINIASVHGLVASELKSAYVTAKHGVVGMTRAAAVEGAQLGITVNAICPGAVMTEMIRKQGPEYAMRSGGRLTEQEALEEAFLGVMPTRRFIEPTEIGQVCAFVCCDAARSITGAAIAIDGGWSAH